MTAQNKNLRDTGKEAKLATIFAAMGGVVALVGALVRLSLPPLGGEYGRVGLGNVLIFLLPSVVSGVLALFCGSMVRRWPLAAAIGLFVAAMVLVFPAVRGYPPAIISCAVLSIAGWLALRLWLAVEERGDGEPKVPES